MNSAWQCGLLGAALACGLAPAKAAPAPVVGKPCLFTEYFAEWRCFPAILLDAQGNLTCGSNRLNQGGVTPAPAAAGRVFATPVPREDGHTPQYHFVYRDTAGGVQDLYFDRVRERDRWFAQRLNDGGRTQAPLAAGDPAGTWFAGRYHVTYRDARGNLLDLQQGPSWRALRLNNGGATPAPAAAGDPVQQVFNGVYFVTYRDPAGTLQEVLFDGAWKARTLNGGGVPSAPPAAGEPALSEFQKARHITYRDRAGRVQDLSYDGAWHLQQLNAGGLTAAPLAAGDPTVLVVDGSSRHVVYRDGAGGIQDLSYDTAWHAVRLNAGGATEAPPAAGDPVALVPPSNWLYVAYVDAQGQAHLLSRHLKEAWKASPLDAGTAPNPPLAPRTWLPVP